MPTYEEADQFWRDWERLSPDERRQFRDAVEKFIEDLQNLPRGQFRRGLRVKPMQDSGGIFEMTWEIRNGRATFQYGDAVIEGEPHVIWRRVGTHAILKQP